jgi:hypothetical protein
MTVRHFVNRVNFSLNYVDGNTLKFRTLRECQLDDLLYHNKAAVEIVLNSAKNCSVAQVARPGFSGWFFLLNSTAALFASSPQRVRLCHQFDLEFCQPRLSNWLCECCSKATCLHHDVLVWSVF